MDVPVLYPRPRLARAARFERKNSVQSRARANPSSAPSGSAAVPSGRRGVGPAAAVISAAGPTSLGHWTVTHVRRTVVDGHLKLYGKQERSLRSVPLPARARRRSTASGTARLPLAVPALGGPLRPGDRRYREWTPAFRAAGLRSMSVRDETHLCALSIAAGVSLYELSRFMGTSRRCSTAPTGTCCPTRSTGPRPSARLVRRSATGRLRRKALGPSGD